MAGGGKYRTVSCSSTTTNADNIMRIAAAFVAFVGDCDGRIALVPILFAPGINWNFFLNLNFDNIFYLKKISNGFEGWKIFVRMN